MGRRPSRQEQAIAGPRGSTPGERRSCRKRHEAHVFAAPSWMLDRRNRELFVLFGAFSATAIELGQLKVLFLNEFHRFERSSIRTK
jgi:hypothetical protein